MKSLTIFSIFLTTVFCITSLSYGETARDIMRNNIERNDGDTMMGRLKISSCRTIRKGRKIVCAEKPRIKILEELRKDYGENGNDTRQFMVILEPAGEKGIGFLQYDYGKVGKENDQWMYFSALGKVKRIIPGKENEPKTGSFFGTELNYEDIEKRRLPDYTYRLLREETFKKRQCKIIESTATLKHFKKSNYSKILDWIDVQTNIRMKTILFDRQGRQFKQITRLDIKKIDGVWTWHKMIINNLKTHRTSIFRIINLAYNFSVQDSFLTQRALTDASFRKKHLNIYRSNY